MKPKPMPAKRRARRIAAEYYGRGWAKLFIGDPRIAHDRSVMSDDAYPTRAEMIRKTPKIRMTSPIQVVLVPLSEWRRLSKPARSARRSRK